jgi:hypothetical protein
MRPVHDAIEDRVGHGRIAQVVMPAISRELTGNDRGPRAIAVVQDLQEVLALGIFEPDEAPIIEDQHIDPGETRQHRRVGSVPMREREFGKQARNAPVDRAMVLPTGLLTPCMACSSRTTTKCAWPLIESHSNAWISRKPVENSRRL